MSRTVNFEMPSRPLLQARFHYSGQDHTFSVLIDSGADANLMDMSLAAQRWSGNHLPFTSFTHHNSQSYWGILG